MTLAIYLWCGGEVPANVLDDIENGRGRLRTRSRGRARLLIVGVLSPVSHRGFESLNGIP